MESGKSVNKLAETIHSLLGMKSHLTSSWVKSVCDIIKTLPNGMSHSETIRDSTEKMDFDTSSVILKIKDELAILTSHINQLNAQRRQVLNDLLDLKGNIRVFCRIRPVIKGENYGHFRPLSALDSSNVILSLADNKSKTYSFDKVFCTDSSQDEVFSEVEPVIKSALDGYNACIFAYGQTGTGKTFTMEGTPHFPGVVPRAIETLFRQAVNSNHAYLFSFSMLEIYLGNLKDLLVPHRTKAMDSMPPCLSIRTDLKGEVEIENLVAIQVNDFNQAMQLYRLGCRFRSTASTNSNTTSSRSHCLIRLSITCHDGPERRRETNKVWLIDLGGSERVLKTKARGRRLEEGKAINLSLSALGDVINALQKKNSHVPYRNSKLTQVLKDSLGEDSKSLMLVHVSPKEEDLCETICSLNFATRVRSTHLGMMDSAEERKQKENAMMNLQQKLKMIEDECQDSINNIKKLNVELENLTGASPSSNELDASSSIQVNHRSPERLRKRDDRTAPILQVPRFMRPTICSKRKSGINNQISEDKTKFTARQRRPLSCAESVSFPVKCTTAYNSDCSISKTSCLTGLNMESSADNGTEYSQDEYDIKMMVFPEQETSTESSIQGCLVNEGNGNRKVSNCSSEKYSKVDNWLSLHKKKPIISGHQSKRILAIPAPEKKHPFNRQKKDNLQDVKDHYNKTVRKMKNIVKLEKLEKCVNVKGSSRSIQEAIKIHKAPTLLEDSVITDSSCELICQSDKIDGDMMNHSKRSLHGQSIEVNKTDSCDQDDTPFNKWLETKEERDEIECSNYLWSSNSGWSQHSNSELDYRMLDTTEDSGLSISISEQEPYCPQVPAEIELEDGQEDDLDNLDQSSAVGSKPSILEMRSRGTLFTGSAKPKDLITTTKDDTQNSGIYHLLTKKIRILWATTLLVMGFQTLGLEHDFFHSLML